MKEATRNYTARKLKIPGREGSEGLRSAAPLPRNITILLIQICRTYKQSPKLFCSSPSVNFANKVAAGLHSLKDKIETFASVRERAETSSETGSDAHPSSSQVTEKSELALKAYSKLHTLALPTSKTFRNRFVLWKKSSLLLPNDIIAAHEKL